MDLESIVIFADEGVDEIASMPVLGTGVGVGVAVFVGGVTVAVTVGVGVGVVVEYTVLKIPNS